MEALALSHAMRAPIDIISAEQPTLHFGTEYAIEELPIVLTFHRYVLALGEHYNSVKPIEVK